MPSQRSPLIIHSFSDHDGYLKGFGVDLIEKGGYLQDQKKGPMLLVFTEKLFGMGMKMRFFKLIFMII